jgi:hypothetical protein
MLLELAEEHDAHDRRAHVECDESDVEKVGKHVAAHDVLREAPHVPGLLP